MTVEVQALLAVLGIACFLSSGCNGEKDGLASRGTVIADVPRAVSVFTLHVSTPSSETLQTGAAEAWKSEDIGFEVPGRVSWVIEPNEDIEGRTPDTSASSEHEQGTVIAKLDDERYRLAVDSAEANVKSLSRDRQALAAEISDSIPAQ